jgi:hypothetical protein
MRHRLAPFPPRPSIQAVASGPCLLPAGAIASLKTRNDRAASASAFETVVRVTSLVNDRAIKVRINDLGPHLDARIIDLSARTARELGIEDGGVVKVKIEALASDQPRV